MLRRTGISSRWLALLAIVVPIAMVGTLKGQSANTANKYVTTGGEWRTYGGDLASTRYSPLDQINASNFNKLEVAWRFKTDNLGERPEFNLQSTPLVANGVLYSTGGTRRAVVALNAATGELKWMYSLDEGKRGDDAPRKLSGRGLAYWTDGRQERIVYVTPGYQMIALDAKTGRPVPTFGKAGIVDLKTEDDQEMDLVTGSVGYHAAPIIAGNTIIMGAAHLSGGVPVSKTNVKGYVRGYDAVTGKRLWIFHTIPRPGEFGNDTWLNDSWSYTGNTGAWGQMTVDEELGMVYVPVEMPTGDYYGGERPGNGLFGESLVALDLKTGQRKWHYQLVHHGVWDYDLPCAPILANVTVNGQQRKVVAQPTKQAWLYVFDRTNGQPIWPMEERPVPQSDVPGEKLSPTQPFVTKPPAYERQGVTVDDLIDFTPELRAQAVEAIKRYKIGPIFSAPVVSKWEGPLALISVPAESGGTVWEGGSLDPETGIVYVFSKAGISLHGLSHDPTKSDMQFIRQLATNPNATPGGGRGGGGGGGGEEGGGRGLNISGLPLLKPPYGRISAIDLNKGDIVWQVAHGDTPDNVKNNPALKGLNIPRTGRPGNISTLVTKTLLIAGEGGVATQPDGRRGALLRAYDKATGKDAGQVYIPAPQSGGPMTYMLGGKQYIVIAISGGTYTGELVAFRLPNS